ncbi:MAG: hypothetical protein DSY43_02720 [Gammaproteobacteria bacterium]|nr:MAG: hypothetical protein DSY43_02720 [Gammaproteobacteria bacterium]
MEAMDSELVRIDVGEGVTLDCVTQHPGFKPVCLEKWSLRLAKDKYKRKDKKSYQQTGSEERYKSIIAL